MMSFNNNCNYGVLIVMGWVCQIKVPSSIITNSVRVRNSHSICLLIKAIKMVLSLLALSWKPGHWMPPNKQESYRDIYD
jgi:hypothetical protein